MQSRVTYERTEKLRLGLKMMGLQAAPYWLSIVLMESASSLVSVIIVIIVGVSFQLRYFTMVNPVGMNLPHMQMHKSFILTQNTHAHTHTHTHTQASRLLLGLVFLFVAPKLSGLIANIMTYLRGQLFPSHAHACISVRSISIAHGHVSAVYERVKIW